MNVFSYLVVMTATDPRDGKVHEHAMQEDAYSLQEAVTQAMMNLEGKFAYLDQGYKMKVVSIKPDMAKARKQVTDLLKDLQLLRMPTAEVKSS